MKPIKKQSWGNLDVFGLLNGQSIWDSNFKNLKYVRRPFDSNLVVKDKIFRNNDYPPDVTKQGLLNGLSNEFGLVPYNMIKKSIFELSYNPIPSGAIDFQDISGYYKDANGNWISLGTQIWNSGYNIASTGFMVWQADRFATISGYKNFSYSTLCEVFTDLDDMTKVKFEYWMQNFDNDGQPILLRFTDMDNQTDPNDQRFTYRKSPEPSLSGIVVYNLNDVPSGIRDAYYFDKTTGIGKELLYNLKTYIDSEFKHTWDKIIDKSCIWDVHKSYGSGHIPSFYDAMVPCNSTGYYIQYSGYIGGVETLSSTLYIDNIQDISGIWYPIIYPGRFYLNGIPFYFFENPQQNYLTLISGSISLPSELERGMYTILVKSGYYNNYCNLSKDVYLSGVYEDYDYLTGSGTDARYIYRRRPTLTSNMGIDIPLKSGEYRLDFNSGILYYSGAENKMELIWEKDIIPSGTLLYYDLNPLTQNNINYEKFFLYLTLNPVG